MNDVGSGGIGAVSIGVSSDVVLVVLVLVAAIVLWKVGRLLWALFAG